MAQVLCFGNLQLDILCCPVTDLPAPGQLRMLDAIEFALSGNGGNVAAALARLGITVELAGYSGADLIGEQLREMLRDQGVGLDLLQRHPSVGTGTSVITLSPDGERSILFVNGANALFDLSMVPDAWLADRRVISVGSPFVLPQFTGDAVGHLFARAHSNGSLTVLNICDDREGQGLESLRTALAETDYFILNADEGFQLTGETNPDKLLKKLAVCTRGTVILTLGADGCCFQQGDKLHTLPALPVEATDCTGAGDSFVAGFIAGLVTGRSLYECARLGCCVAACAVVGPGAYTRIPSLASLEHPDFL